MKYAEKFKYSELETLRQRQTEDTFTRIDLIKNVISKN